MKNHSQVRPLNHPTVLQPASVLFEDPIIATDLQLLIDILPERIRRALQAVDLTELIEIVMDLARLPEASFYEGEILELGEQQVTLEEIHHVVKHMGYFTSDNRAGIPRTLHRISAMRNRQGDIVGL